MPQLLKRHLAGVFPAVSDLFGARAIFSAEVGRCKPARRPSVAWPLVWRLQLVRCSISMTTPPTWQVPVRRDCRRIGWAGRPTCAPASRLTGLPTLDNEGERYGRKLRR
jgi:hypothetical protein